jgi:uncharacterized protein (TIGR02246 family)
MTTTNEAEIRGLIDDWVKALCARDIDALVSNYARDVVSFDVVNPLQWKGVDAVRKRAEEWISSWKGPINSEIRELSITADDDVAFSHHLSRFSGTKKGGGEIDMWIRATLGLGKVGGKWMVTHEHVSVPFDPQSGQASLDLKP